MQSLPSLLAISLLFTRQFYAQKFISAFLMVDVYTIEKKPTQLAADFEPCYAAIVNLCSLPLNHDDLSELGVFF